MSEIIVTKIFPLIGSDKSAWRSGVGDLTSRTLTDAQCVHTGASDFRSAFVTSRTVVSKMVILGQQNCISGTNKIPEYARDFKNEYLFIRGINKEMDNFVEKYLTDTSELFVSSYSDKIKFFIKKFMKAQELKRQSP